MTARCQLRALLGVVEQLAVEDRENVPVLVADRLLAIRQADHTEPPRGQRHSGTMQEAFLIRTAVDQARDIRSTTPSGAARLPAKSIIPAIPHMVFCSESSFRRGGYHDSMRIAQGRVSPHGSAGERRNLRKSCAADSRH